jgi:hypothetical protein
VQHRARQQGTVPKLGYAEAMEEIWKLARAIGGYKEREQAEADDRPAFAIGYGFGAYAMARIAEYAFAAWIINADQRAAGSRIEFWMAHDWRETDAPREQPAYIRTVRSDSRPPTQQVGASKWSGGPVSCPGCRCRRSRLYLPQLSSRSHCPLRYLRCPRQPWRLLCSRRRSG